MIDTNDIHQVCEGATELAQNTDASRLVVFDNDLELYVCWYGGATFSVFDSVTHEEYDCFTVYGDDRGNPITSLDDAAAAIAEHFDYLREAWGFER